VKDQNDAIIAREDTLDGKLNTVLDRQQTILGNQQNTIIPRILSLCRGVRVLGNMLFDHDENDQTIHDFSTGDLDPDIYFDGPIQPSGDPWQYCRNAL